MSSSEGVAMEPSANCLDFNLGSKPCEGSS